MHRSYVYNNVYILGHVSFLLQMSKFSISSKFNGLDFIYTISTKRKKVVTEVKNKLNIIKHLRKSESAPNLTTEYNVGKSTIKGMYQSTIVKKNRDKYKDLLEVFDSLKSCLISF